MRRALLVLLGVLAAIVLGVSLTGCAVRGPLGGTFTYTPPGWIGDPPEPIDNPEPSGATKTKAPPSPGDSPVVAPPIPAPPVRTTSGGGGT